MSFPHIMQLQLWITLDLIVDVVKNSLCSETENVVPAGQVCHHIRIGNWKAWITALWALEHCCLVVCLVKRGQPYTMKSIGSLLLTWAILHNVQGQATAGVCTCVRVCVHLRHTCGVYIDHCAVITKTKPTPLLARFVVVAYLMAGLNRQ